MKETLKEKQTDSLMEKLRDLLRPMVKDLVKYLGLPKDFHSLTGRVMVILMVKLKEICLLKDSKMEIQRVNPMD